MRIEEINLLLGIIGTVGGIIGTISGLISTGWHIKNSLKKKLEISINFEKTNENTIHNYLKIGTDYFLDLTFDVINKNGEKPEAIKSLTLFIKNNPNKIMTINDLKKEGLKNPKFEPKEQKSFTISKLITKNILILKKIKITDYENKKSYINKSEINRLKNIVATLSQNEARDLDKEREQMKNKIERRKSEKANRLITY
ncbi:MAG: hypothetical protein JXJ04_19255 [Spirochaetales bacterium]|nr:hypothetical protein [Spirochaetales bacterium]